MGGRIVGLNDNNAILNSVDVVVEVGVELGNIEISKCSKVPVVGTLNLCLEMPDSVKKV